MGYRLDRSRFYLPRFAFSDEEIRALVIAVRRLAEMKGFSMAREARSVLRKLVFDSPCGEEADGSLAFYYSGHYTSPELETVTEALMHKKSLRMTYYSLHSDSVSERTIYPYALLQRRGGWYLVAWCCLRNDLRQFRLERIRSIQMNRKHLDTADYTIPRDFSLKDYMGKETWDYSAARPTSVEVKMSRGQYQQARARWSDRDDVSFPSKRRNVVVMKVRDDTAFCRWVLAQQGGVEILSPRRLRRQIRALIKRMIERHTSGEEAAT
jgi:predicted DNA-binding transcriptional regulator YafY